MIHFEGDRSFPLPPTEVFAKLSDASFLLGCLNDVEAVVEQSADRAVWKLHPSFAFVRTKLDITLEIVERVPASSIRMKMFSRGIGATSTVLAMVALQPTAVGTAVHWSADITELTGLLKLAPKGLISSAAHKVIDDNWAAISTKLGE